MLTRKERLKKRYYYQELDRPAVYSRTGFPKNDSSYDKLKSFLRQYTELKASFNGRAFDSPYPIEKSIEPYSDAFQKRAYDAENIGGRFAQQFAGQFDQSARPARNVFVKGYQRRRKISLAVFVGDVSGFCQSLRDIGDDGIVDVSLGLNPAGFIAELFGTENFVMFSVTDCEIVHLLMRYQMEVILERVKFLLANGVGPFFSMLDQEYITPPLRSPKD
ncbi:MAG: hypothetical protein A2Y10_09130 [Planctomycetes bacterium GWF2_41_51]|nr:MAG: hypothetical protein A2Y10_09130 [Planctomycetes bacterium GWF2_41_51]HBG26704.1 hypothetical protein [Phycisphaerales bacterium]